VRKTRERRIDLLAHLERELDRGEPFARADERRLTPPDHLRERFELRAERLFLHDHALDRLDPGTHTLRVSYTGDPEYADATSNTVTRTVSPGSA